MVKRIALAMLATVLASSTALGQEWATKMFQTTEHDFGTVARGAKAEFDFTFSNLYLEDVHVVGVRSSCGCTTPSVVTPNLKTYEQGAIHAVFNTGTFLGNRAATLTVTIDRPFYAEVQLHIKGYIRSDVVFEPGSVQFGEVEQGVTVQRRVLVNYAGRGDWQITGVKTSNPNITAKVVQTGREDAEVSYLLQVSLKGSAVGYFQDQLMLVTSEGQGTQMPLTIEGRVVSGISVSPASLFMGVVGPGHEVTKSLVVKSGRPFRILSITCDDPSFTFGRPTDPTPKTIHVVPVRFTAGTDLGKVAKTIRIVTDVGQTTPELAAYAVVAAPSADEDD